MNNFIYETPTKVYFGKDEELKVGKIIAEFHPKKVLVHFWIHLRRLQMDWRIRKWMSGIFIVVKLFHRRHFRREQF